MTTLAELLAALATGEVTDVTARVDNDNIDFSVEDESILSLHPYEFQMQALAALGVRAEAI